MKVTLSRIACIVALVIGSVTAPGITEAGGLWLPVGYPLVPAPVVVAAPVVVPAPVYVSRSVVVARPVAPVAVVPTPHQYKHAYRSARRASRWGW